MNQEESRCRHVMWFSDASDASPLDPIKLVSIRRSSTFLHKLESYQTRWNLALFAAKWAHPHVPELPFEELAKFRKNSSTQSQLKSQISGPTNTFCPLHHISGLFSSTLEPLTVAAVMFFLTQHWWNCSKLWKKIVKHYSRHPVILKFPSVNHRILQQMYSLEHSNFQQYRSRGIVLVRSRPITTM